MSWAKMASPSDKSSSSRGSAALMPGRIVIVCDATKSVCGQELKHIIANIQMQENMIQEVDTITVLGVLHKVLHPMGFEMQIGPDSFIGTGVRAIKEEVSRMVDKYVGILQHSAEECEDRGVIIEAKIVVGAPLKKVIVQEVVASNATWVVLNRHLKKELRFYLKHIPCKVAMALDNSSMEVLRSYYSDKATMKVEHESFYSMSKIVPIVPAEYSMSNEQSFISPSYNGSLSPHESYDSAKSSSMSSLTPKFKEQSLFSPDIEVRANPQNEKSDLNSEVDVKSDEVKTRLDFKGFDYSEIQIATNNFSSDNLLGENGYGVVYKGRLKDGQLIALTVQKEANRQSFLEFYSQVCALSLACHKNIVMLLGYCCRENVNILVYEYICNKSLEWHLFDNTEFVLPWHWRHAIVIGIAKGLRFLHEECRGNPIIHGDMRPSNIFLTNEFVPLLGDCGIAKWNTNKHDRKTQILGTYEYLAPEYAENETSSLKTDVFAFGIILIQLISGRKRVDPTRSLTHWARPLIETLSLNELVDPRLGGSYSTYEVYQMAKVAILCIQTKPALRPTIGEALQILEGKSEHINHVADHSNVQKKSSI